jgi:hypothetical protein
MDIFIIGYNISPKQHIWYNDASNRAHRVHCRNFQPHRHHHHAFVVLVWYRSVVGVRKTYTFHVIMASWTCRMTHFYHTYDSRVIGRMRWKRMMGLLQPPSSSLRQSHHHHHEECGRIDAATHLTVATTTKTAGACYLLPRYPFELFCLY